jgi:Raf kinase inhibitor-like YbhB/YbcL family protein
MKFFKLAIAIAATAFAVSGAIAQTPMQLSSTSIVNGKILQPHACGRHGGKDVSVQLSVKNIPANAKYVAILMDDPDAPGGVWVHWNLFNVAVKGSTLDIPAGSPPAGDIGMTSDKTAGYDGMCPPNGTHNYRFAVFAMKEKIEVGGFFGPSAMHIDYFGSKFSDSIITKAQITGKFD